MAWASRGSRLLTGTSAASLVRDHGAIEEQLPSPDTPGLATLEGAGEALIPQGTEAAQGLGDIDMLRPFGEPEVRVELATRDGLTRPVSRGDAFPRDEAAAHESTVGRGRNFPHRPFRRFLTGPLDD